MARNNLGLPYKGSKNTIAEAIVSHMPSGAKFLDACCGGGAVLEAAYMSRKFGEVHGIDIDEGIILLLRAVFRDFGQIDYEHRQLKKFEDFKKANENRKTLEDAVTRFTCSFGFNGYDYQWGEKRRHLKYLAHQSLTLPTLDGRRSAFHSFIRDLIASGKLNALGDEWSIKLVELKNLAHTEQATNICRLQKVESVMRAESKTNPTALVIGKQSMFDIDYEPFDVIYFDPPYAETKGYDKSKFDYERFTELIEGLVLLGKEVFVSEYSSPSPLFEEVYSTSKQMSVCATKTVNVTEKLFHGVNPSRNHSTNTPECFQN